MTLGPVLLVEDSAADAELAIAALERAGLRNPILHLPDGEGALHHLRTTVASQRTQPALVLLDLGLPGLDGRDVLAAMKADTRLAQVPVVVLTGAGEAERSVLDYYGLDPRAAIAKPLTLRSLIVAAAASGAYFQLAGGNDPSVRIIRTPADHDA